MNRFQGGLLIYYHYMRTKTPKAATVATTKAAMPSRKTEEITLMIPRADLEAITIFANHFGITPEMVMEWGLIGQLTALTDSVFISLAIFDESPPIKDPAPVTLAFIPEAHALLVLAARLIRRPLKELAADLLRQDALCLCGDMEEAEKSGGIDNHKELISYARSVIDSEFEARRGRMVKDGHGFDAWVLLQLESFRPSRLKLSAKA